MQLHNRYNHTQSFEHRIFIVHRTLPSRRSQVGSTPIWLILWLAGMAAIAYWCIARHVPALQQQVQDSAAAALGQVEAPEAKVATHGRTATLTGFVDSDAKRSTLISAVQNADGVRNVNDELSIVGSASADADTQTVATSQESQAVETTNTSDTAPANTPSQTTPSVDNSSTSTETEADNQAQPPVTVSDNESASATETVDTEDAAEIESNAEVEVEEIAEAEQPILQEETIEPEETDSSLPETSTETVNSIEAKAQALIEQARTNQLPAISTNTQAPTTQASDQTTAALETTNTDDATDALAETIEAPIADSSEADELLAASEPAALTLLVTGETLNLTGDVSDKDSLLPFVQTAMNTFSSNYVINSVQVNPETAQADWLVSLTSFLPNMGSISDASIEIVDSQISLSGIASSQKQHDAVIDNALSMFPSLSLVERISISEEPEAVADSPTLSEPSEPVNDATNEQNTIEANSAQQAADTDAEVITTEPTNPPSLSLREAFEALQTERILFESGSDVLTRQSLRSIETMSELFAQYPDAQIEIDGHTDSQGSSSRNLELSQLRANAVRDYLIQQGIDPTRLSAYGFGDGVPIADNATAAGRALNRRIEFNF